MWLESYLTEGLAVAKMEGVSKKRTLENLANIIAEQSQEFDADTLFQNFIGRERLGSTGIGSGIAIPHCRFNTGGKTMCACITLSEPVDFDAIDQKPVDIIFAMVVPEDAENVHLEQLAALAKALQNPSYVAALRKAENSKALYKCAISD